MWYDEITPGIQFSNNADIWQTLTVLNFSTSQINIHKMVITKTDDGSIQQYIFAYTNNITNSDSINVQPPPW